MRALAASRLVEGLFNEETVRTTARELRAELGEKPTLGFIFATEQYQDHWADFSETLRIHGHLPILVGATSTGIIGTNHEVEGAPGTTATGFSALFLHLPETSVRVFQVTNELVENSSGKKVLAS